MSRRASASLLLSSVFMLHCSTFQQIRQNFGGKPEAATETEAPEVKPGAERTLVASSACTGIPASMAAEARGVLDRTCPGLKGASLSEVRGDFDDRKPSALKAAFILMDAATPKPGPPMSREEAAQWVPDKEVALIASNYIEYADPARIQASLQGTKLPGDVQAAFLKSAQAARTFVAQEAQKASPRLRAVFTKPVEEVKAERKTYFAKHATLLAEFDALEPKVRAALESKSAPVDLVASLHELRSKYFVECGQQSCRTDRFVAMVGYTLLQIHNAAGAGVQAEAERILLDDKRALRSTFAAESADALYVAIEAERAEYRKTINMNKEQVRAAFADAPPERVMEASLLPLGLGELRPASLGTVRRELASVQAISKQPSGSFVIAFKDTITHSAECKEYLHTVRQGNVSTSKVVKQCKPVDYHREHMPIVVSAAEAKSLRTGETVLALYKEGSDPKIREGAVVVAYATSTEPKSEVKIPGTLLAFRDVRLEAMK